LIPMRHLLQELSTATKLIVGSTIAHSTIFEDNKGCVELASAPRMRPRTRHIGLKNNHFRSHVDLGHLTIQWIDTKNQLADIFTKPLEAASFITLRQTLQGW
ncbi:MAG: Ty1/Copia family ribonuclease HI, partial [bacterium]